LDGIHIRDNRIIFYGNTAGYVDDENAIVDPIFQSEELKEYLTEKQNLKVQWINGVWCDALADCQADRSLKSTLIPIVNKLSDTRIVNGELENLVFEPRKEFIIMAILVVGNIPFLFFLNRSWFHTLMYNPIGQVMLALTAAAVFISTAFMIKFTKPIEYKR
jgi:hypothetical protein